MRHCLLLLFIALLAASCNQNKEAKTVEPPTALGEKIRLNPNDTPTVYIEDIAAEMYRVKLKTDSGFSIKHISNLFVTDSAIIVADRLQSMVLIFDEKGRPATRIHNLHERNDNYTNIADVAFDSENGLIEILDLDLKKIFRYRTSGLPFDTLTIVGIKDFGLTFAKSGDFYVSEMLNNNNNKYMRRISLYHRSGNMLTPQAKEMFYWPIQKNLDLTFPHQFENYGNDVYYFPLLDRNIYSLSGKGIKPAYTVELPESIKPNIDIKTEATPKDHFAYWNRMESSNLMYDNNSLFINDDWVTFRYSFGSRRTPRNVFYHKKSGKVMQTGAYKTKSDSSFLSKGRVLARMGEYFVMPVPMKPPGKKPVSEIKDIPALRNFELLYVKLKEPA
ncbi:6-bladed beta-propeller [Pedobacter deserti]|uniref:6-bladed beta-propeller n=1 Tax=Pedobacter deserti TaxID=2817382 RepID=UPI00210E7BF1|nr:6-bladed beta-propeller [Pedobacter sp. SYSU D00382]